MATTNISCEGDRQFVENLGMLAKKRRMTMGRLVRTIIDSAVGTELAQIEKAAAIFFADECASEFTTELTSTEVEHAPSV